MHKPENCGVRSSFQFVIALVIRALLRLLQVPGRVWTALKTLCNLLDCWSANVINTRRRGPVLTAAIQSGKVIPFPRRHTA